MKYRIGQNVVYIGPDFRSHPVVALHRFTVPAPLAVYTIRGHSTISCGPHAGMPGYYFEEYKNRVGFDRFLGIDCEVCAVDEPFLRPDISIFEEQRRAIEAGNYDLVRDKVRA